ncbi:5-carboxymethyl-2-hydroxymuconate semialdehyde dehydrogenase [Paenarthrobacter sp. 2TAF44]|uniref:5-carboxymethyl-2-hydroxymuconate semialdehyde dehydrogenase n=1 Tax=Paenarthrobacter sp. 2TAF44 TaxID=3233018 RepID=UPI003F998388
MTTSVETARHSIPENLPTHLQHFIDGEFVDSVSGKTFDVQEPVSNQNYATVTAAQPEDVDRAVAAAKRAFKEGPWPKMLPRERSRVLHKIADIVESRDDELALLESFDSGLPITQAKGQARRAAENFRFFADLIVSQEDNAFKVPGRQINYVNRKPIGVAGLITPWNVPFMQESWKLAPAIATGNTVVMKPASYTPLSAVLWPEIFREAGLPDGVFNLIFGSGSVAGDYLVKHPGVPIVSFTGDSSTGATISTAAAPQFKSLSLELGGKSPAIVFADADIEAALDATVFGVFSLNGERCTAGSRVLVQREIYDDFVARFAERAKNIVVGLPSDPATEVGSLVHPTHFDKVMSYIEIGKTEGRLLAGGGRAEGFPEGNYVAPTVFADVAPDARIFQEEIFGPVVAITPFDTDEEALELANNTKYGLAAYVWTTNLKRAHNFAHAIESGMVWLNSNNVRDLRTPFGGVKASGLGREGGYRSVDFYTTQQSVQITLNEAHSPKFGSVKDAAATSDS